MRTKINMTLALAVMLSLCFHLGDVSFAADAAKQTPPREAPPRKSSGVKFRPPQTAASNSTPSVRVTGGSRGTGDNTVTLDVLAPDQAGQTTLEQPSLFWFQSRPATAKFELTVLQENKVKPLVQFSVDRPMKTGIQRLKLSEHGAKLEPGVEYQWIVALVTDAENRSTDLVASGVVKRVAPTADLKANLAKAAPEELASVYADSGIWYDALAALSDQIEAHPENKELRQARADLLQQVGLKAAAQFEANEVMSSRAK